MNNKKILNIVSGITNYLSQNFKEEEIEDILNSLIIKFSKDRYKAEVTSENYLTSEQTQKIEKFIRKKQPFINKINYLVDKTILGGFKIKIGDDLYDYSLNGRFKQLEEGLSKI